MASSFPPSLDAFTNPSSTDAMDSVSVPHATQHSDLNDAVEALEAKVGADSSAVTSSHDYKIADHASRITTLEGASSGLTLITSSSFSGSSAVSVDNCFTSSHTAYQIVFLATGSANGNLYMRFRNSGTDTTANYDVGEAVLRYSDGYFANDGNGNAQTLMILGYVNTARTQHTITVWEPYETQYTGMWYNASHPDLVEWGGAQHTVQTSFDGFTIWPSTGTISGNLYVYGMATS